MKVSVVILNWNGCDMLRTFLPSVVRYSKGEGIEVCVADNGSTDDSVALLQQEFPSVRTIVLDRNYGFADGYNGITAGRCRICSAFEFGCRGDGALAGTNGCLSGCSSGGGCLSAEDT